MDEELFSIRVKDSTERNIVILLFESTDYSVKKYRENPFDPLRMESYPRSFVVYLYFDGHYKIEEDCVSDEDTYKNLKDDFNKIIFSIIEFSKSLKDNK